MLQNGCVIGPENMVWILRIPYVLYMWRFSSLKSMQTLKIRVVRFQTYLHAIWLVTWKALFFSKAFHGCKHVELTDGDPHCGGSTGRSCGKESHQCFQDATIARWWFSNIFIFTSIWGRFSNLTNIFQMGWNHQPDYCFPTFVLYFFIFLSPRDQSRYRTSQKNKQKKGVVFRRRISLKKLWNIWP